MSYITPHFLLTNSYARELYHNWAKDLPIVDYHCHLDPAMIAQDIHFENIGQMWLGGDHYKWRAMRAAGIPEEYITGNASWEEKFEKWALTLPLALRNPLYHWTHLELKRIFDIDEVLSPRTARSIWERCNELLQQPGFSAVGIAQKCHVELICTTDDPIDALPHHKALATQKAPIKVFPTWRPDRITQVEDNRAFNAYIDRLEAASGLSIDTFTHLMEALRRRHDFFAQMGCRLSDHGLDTFYSTPYTTAQIHSLFDKMRRGTAPSSAEAAQFKSAMLYELAVMDYEKGWTQQFHIGPIRNNALSMLQQIGADAGFDAIDDKALAASGFRFFDRLYSEGKLAKTILYNLNPKDNEVMAVMANTYNEAPVSGKIQYGAAWWFLDNEQGIRRQIDSLSNAGLLGTFIGMLTDSRSILSYPRHEYFRRILCDILGTDLATGRLPQSEIESIGETVSRICYHNCKQYLGL